ncbi:FadR/GntR family transcriptional regulator [Chelativorans sp. Marseille-P2723]|uniref:FadR/GntR family transcriptional regulator n=1 Tax=Chelativorans sp. Marseille-P2723 TaxID=2709133 RepID=UPI00156DEA40|nr:FadR/GntR family transcriptional regulator [Chelativorans sp. Marseille-P2723]
MAISPDRPDSFNLPVLDTAPGYKRVADLIEREIVGGRIKPGDMLPTEIELAAQLGVHRSTVREGIRSLENSGLIKRVGGKRLIVSVPEQSAVAWYNTRAMALRKVSFFELWEVQMEIEPFCADLAAARITDQLADEMRESLRRLEENLEDDEAVIAHDIEFHRIIARAARNGALELSVEPVSVLLFSATTTLYQKVPPARHRLLQAHKTIADAICARDRDAAREWMTKHIRDFRRGYLIAGLSMDAPITLDPRAMRP